MAGLPILVITEGRQGDVAGLIGLPMFGVTMVLLYQRSTLYHTIPAGKTKDLFQVLDHHGQTMGQRQG